MKKGIAILIIVLFMAACAIVEPLFTNSVYKKMETTSLEIMELLSVDKEHINTKENIKAAEDFDKFWDSKKSYLQIISHQATINDFEMKLARLYAAIKANEYPMALTELEQIYRGTYEQNRVNRLHISNIF